MSDYAIVVVGYNRVHELERLLYSINNADFEEDNVSLIISLDNCGSEDVYLIANAFEWKHGEKKVRLCPERLGLRNHILSCGDYLEEYEAIAVLEDDLFVAPDFYRYMKQAVAFYSKDDRIAGISLYNHLWNVNVSYPFQPARTEYDNYFLQFAQSWGQVWMKRQWFAFKEWYVNNQEEFGYQKGIPDFVCGWKNNSWLKYHIRYCIEQNKFFVYPYESLTTCFSEPGEHALYRTSTYQVPLYMGSKGKYQFVELKEDAVKYDAFFERILTRNIGDLSVEQICMDLFGSKREELYKRYVFSTKKLNYKIVKTYALELRPIELNVIAGVEGTGIFLYDTQSSAKNIVKVKEQAVRVWLYHIRAFVKKKLICWAFVQFFLQRVGNIIRKK